MSAQNVYHLELMVEEINSRSQMPLSSLFRLECHSMAISKSATAIGGLTVMRSSEKPSANAIFSGTMAIRSRFFNKCRMVRKLREATVTLRLKPCSASFWSTCVFKLPSGLTRACSMLANASRDSCVSPFNTCLSHTVSYTHLTLPTNREV